MQTAKCGGLAHGYGSGHDAAASCVGDSVGTHLERGDAPSCESNPQASQMDVDERRASAAHAVELALHSGGGRRPSVSMGCVDSAEHSAGAARSAVETQATAQLLMACVAARVPHAHAMYGVAVVLSAMGGDRAEQRTS